MTRELLNIFGMNIMMAEDANEPSLRVRPRRKIRRNRKKQSHRRQCAKTVLECMAAIPGQFAVLLRVQVTSLPAAPDDAG